MNTPPSRDYWPSTDWQSSPAENQGMDPAVLSRLQTYAQESTPQVSALVIVRNGYVVFEDYAQGYDKESYFNVYSITKSVVSALIGVALGQGLISDINRPVLNFFPEWADRVIDQRAHAITVRHLLSMTSGFDEAACSTDELWRAEEVVAAALMRPVVHEPGERFVYADVSTHLLSVLLSRLTGTAAAAYATKALFARLGSAADRLTWEADPQGHSIGAFGLHLTARQMAKLGYLYANGGRWDDAQIIPQDYVEQSTRRQSAGGPPVGQAHGYLWWIPEPHPAFFAAGLGGQTIHVVPGLNLVTVFTTLATDRAAVHRGKILEQYVLPAIRHP